MGQNSTEVAYGFGQFGSAFADTAANTITAPETLAIVAIQFLADTSLSALVAKDVNLFPNTVGAAHDRGHQTIQVDGAVSSAANIQFNNDVTCASLGLKLGDEVYLTATGALLGTITVLNVGNTRTITISATTSISDDHYVSIVTPNKTGDDLEGTGGQALAAAQVFPKGLTIYGRWDSVSLNADDTDGGIICYFGK
tara:strand:- start:20 stop:610 length:591 start_codon:yes stop_codon:yes gene_type:complete